MLATIELDGNEGKGYLFLKNGTIWCEQEKEW
jgi:hypothetical protein